MPVPLPDQNVFVSYNFEANYNMPSWPNESFPGPLNRVKLNNRYPATKLGSDATPDDTIARKLKDNVDVEESDETTIIPNKEEEENDDKREKRSFIDTTIFTRVGIYLMLEKRLDA